MDHLSDNIPRDGAMSKCLLVSFVFGNVGRLCSGGATRGRNGHPDRMQSRGRERAVDERAVIQERLGWFPATIDFAQKLPSSGDFLLAAGITDTAHQASTPSENTILPFPSSTSQGFLSVEGGSGHSMGDQLCLSRLVTRCGRSDRAWMEQMFAEGRRWGQLPAVVL